MLFAFPSFGKDNKICVQLLLYQVSTSCHNTWALSQVSGMGSQFCQCKNSQPHRFIFLQI